jgi:Uma2 family endonuclease
MFMAIKTARWTRADLARFPDDGNRYEVLDGELLVTPQAAPDHQGDAFELAVALRGYCTLHSIGAIASPGAVVFGKNELQSDLLVIPGIARVTGKKWEELPLPMLVVEILSSTWNSSRSRDLNVKRHAYLRLGIETYWVIDPPNRCVHVWTQGAGHEVVVTHVLRWQPNAEIAPFEITVGELMGAEG